VRADLALLGQHAVAQARVEPPELAEGGLHRERRRRINGRLDFDDVTSPGEREERARNAERHLH